MEKKNSKGTTYIIAIIVLYLEDSRGPKMERAFRAIHQMRPARISFHEPRKEPECQTTRGKKPTHENSNEQIQADGSKQESYQ